MNRLMVICSLIFALAVAQAGERLRLASGEWPPYAGASLPQEGIAARIIRAALADEGVEVEFVHLSWRRGLELARRGHLHGAILWQANSPSDDFLASEPILHSEVVLAFRPGLPLHDEELHVRPGTRIGLPNGYKYEQIPAVQTLLDQAGTTPIMITDDEGGLKAVQKGRIDVFPVDRGVARWLLHKDPGMIQLRASPIEVEGLSVLLYRHHDRSAHWIARLNAGIARLRESGRLATLSRGE